MLSSAEFKGDLRKVHGERRRGAGAFPALARSVRIAVRRLFQREVADGFKAAARRIAASLQYGFFGRVEVN